LVLISGFMLIDGKALSVVTVLVDGNLVQYLLKSWVILISRASSLALGPTQSAGWEAFLRSKATGP
jgi:hypothetical protein